MSKANTIKVGEIVTGRFGRQMRVMDLDERITINDELGPPLYRLCAIDDPYFQVLWPREWVTAYGQTMPLQFGEVV